MAVIVVKYGVHHKWAKNLPAVVVEQLRAAHTVRNELVAISLRREEALRDLWSTYPDVAAAEAAVAQAQERVDAALEASRHAAVTQRTRAPKGPTSPELKEARTALRAARTARRTAISAARQDAKPEITQIHAEEKAAAKDLYRLACTDGNLYWPTFNALADKHRAAVQRVGAARAEGKPASLRFRRWDGTGLLAVQLQRATGAPPRTPATIADPAGRWRNVLHLPWVDPDPWDRLTRAQQRRTVRMRCGSVTATDGTSTPAWVDIPVQMHRMLPADADITSAELVITRVGATPKAHLCVTARIPDPAPVTDGPTVAVHLGWHQSKDGGTIVATWAADQPLDVDPDLRQIMTCDPGRRAGTVTLADTVLDHVVAADKIRSARDLELDLLRSDLVDWLTAHGPLPHPTRVDEDGHPEQVTAQGVARWRSPARFAALATGWRSTPPAGAQELRDRLEAWRVSDKRAWNTSEHGRAKSIARRGDLYRQVAAEIAALAGRVVVDDTSVAALARDPASAEKMADTGLPATLLEEASARRAHTAPGSLRAAITAAATREGVPMTVTSAKGLSSTCHRCGGAAGDIRTGRIVTCDQCGAAWDPDRNAVAIMLQRSREG